MKQILILLVLLSVETVFAQDKTLALATACAACHGSNGVSANPLWPNLAGQKAEYLAKQMRDFKAGRRQDPLMSPMAQTVADADIDKLAQHFANIKP